MVKEKRKGREGWGEKESEAFPIHIFGYTIGSSCSNSSSSSCCCCCCFFLSFPVEEAGHCPNTFQEVPEASWISCDQVPVMNSQEPEPRRLQRFAEPVKSEASDK